MDFKLMALATTEELPGKQGLMNLLFENGLETLHLRTIEQDENQFQEYISGISPEFHKRLVIHTHYSLSAKFQLRGIHLTEKTKHTFTNPGGKQLSASFHNLEELSENKINYAYVFLSPVFNSISKEGHTSAFREQDLVIFLNALKKKSSRPLSVFALGGINIQTITRVKEIGFDGAVLNGGIWKTEDPVKTYLSVRSTALVQC